MSEVKLVAYTKLVNCRRFKGVLPGGWECAHLHHTPQKALICAKRQITVRKNAEQNKAQ